MKERICLVVAVRCGSVPVLWVAGVIGGPVWTHTHTKKGGGCLLFSFFIIRTKCTNKPDPNRNISKVAATLMFSADNPI